MSELLPLGCGRVGFAPGLGDSSPLDTGSEDARVSDTGAGDTGLDGSSDAGALPVVTCGAPTPVAPTPPTLQLLEPGLRADGLTLLARAVDTRSAAYVAQRGDTAAPFGPWILGDPVASGTQDQTYLDFEGEELSAISRSPGRHLFICRPPFGAGDCVHADIYDETGALIADDHDGPTLAIRDGGLIMAFNRDTTLYLAQPRSSTFTEWDAAPIDLGIPRLDDPSMTNDGKFLLAASGTEIYAATWDAAAGAYANVHVIEGARGWAVEIGNETGTGFELFTTGDSRGIDEPCVRTCLIR